MRRADAGPANGHYGIVLSVENHAAVDAAFRRGVAKGAGPVMEPAAEPWGRRIRYEADPEGNPVEIGSFGV
ncbi:VOC family protein [Alistipes sp.]|uniref:VOC family protein n=1 Tax=Alistipes sp. TaxID=1872444 RepID=UPI0025BE94EE|nr:VOC family protein [Alistipes sp.]